jgi:hypothetical protein
MIIVGTIFLAGAALLAVGTAIHRAMEGSAAYVSQRSAMGAAGHEEA